MPTYYEQLLSRLPHCSPHQRSAFLACAVRRAVQAFVSIGNPRAIAVREQLNQILARLPAGLPPADCVNPLARLAEELLQASAADNDSGEPRDRVGFYLGTATLQLCNVLSGQADGLQKVALCASHVIHILEQVYEDEEVGGREKNWQAHAVLSSEGPLSAGAILALPDYEPGPVCRYRR